MKGTGPGERTKQHSVRHGRRLEAIEGGEGRLVCWQNHGYCPDWMGSTSAQKKDRRNDRRAMMESVWRTHGGVSVRTRGSITSDAVIGAHEHQMTLISRRVCRWDDYVKHALGRPRSTPAKGPVGITVLYGVSYQSWP